jgi:hypothetical protein
MKITLAASLTLALFCASATSAQNPNQNRGIGSAKAAKSNRAALVIGNAAYKTSPLTNPVNDARDIARSLRELGFEVVY